MPDCLVCNITLLLPQVLSGLVGDGVWFNLPSFFPSPRKTYFHFVFQFLPLSSRFFFCNVDTSPSTISNLFSVFSTFSHFPHVLLVPSTIPLPPSSPKGIFSLGLPISPTPRKIFYFCRYFLSLSLPRTTFSYYPPNYLVPLSRWLLSFFSSTPFFP